MRKLKIGDLVKQKNPLGTITHISSDPMKDEMVYVRWDSSASDYATLTLISEIERVIEPFDIRTLQIGDMVEYFYTGSKERVKFLVRISALTQQLARDFENLTVVRVWANQDGNYILRYDGEE